MPLKKRLTTMTLGGIYGNFITGTLEYGVYEYKRGYGGFVIEYIGEFDVVINKRAYFAYTHGLKIYEVLLRITKKFKKINRLT